MPYLWFEVSLMKYVILALMLTSCCENEVCTKVKIAKIGGCDKSGYCGVILENGFYRRETYHPVEGLEVNYCECKENKK